MGWSEQYWDDVRAELEQPAAEVHLASEGSAPTLTVSDNPPPTDESAESRASDPPHTD